MIEIDRNVHLKGLNTFGLDVFASHYVCIRKQDDLSEMLESDAFGEYKPYVLGLGSNILFINDYIEGLIIHISLKGVTIVENGSERVIVEVAAGEDWSAFVDKMVDSGLGGIENLSLIPGTVGAAPLQNIGAYGVELKDSFVSLKAFDLLTGKIISFGLDDCEFGYRTSMFKSASANRYIILSVRLKLTKKHRLKTDYGDIRKILAEEGIENPGIRDINRIVKQIRLQKLPDPKVLGNAGSFFKNPILHPLVFEGLRREHNDVVSYPDENGFFKVSAGWLIEQAGWKGKRIGNVGMHDKQALVLVNYGGATGSELYQHAMNVQYSVKQKFGILLEPEVNIIS
jgi:UDP-N-acetylmuramate dehydrogenase